MSKSIFKLGSLILLLTLVCACKTDVSNVVSEFETNKPFLGAWEMVSIEWITKDTTYSIMQAQPGLFTFTDTRYSIMWTPTEEPRAAFKLLSDPTEEEIIAGFRSVIFNGGKYASTDSTITTTANIAKVPGFEGGKQFYNYEVKGETMILTMHDETYPNGDKPTWSGEYQTRFTMKKS